VFLCALTLTVFLAGCGKPAATQQPSGARVSSTNSFPSTVLVGISNTGICSGSIIAENAILTAAHCVDGINDASDLRVRLADGRTVRAKKVRSTGGVNVDSTDDLAVLIMNEKIAKKGVDEICKIDPNQIRVNEKVTVVGYGTNDNVKRAGSGVKRAGENVIYAAGRFVELRTTISSGGGTSGVARGVIGSVTDAGSGFGDSGGGLRLGGMQTTSCSILAVVHAGGMLNSTTAVSEFVRLDGENLDWLRSVFRSEGLDVDIL